MLLLRKTPTGKAQLIATPAALAAHMKQGKDLDPLRARWDFQQLLLELDTAGAENVAVSPQVLP